MSTHGAPAGGEPDFVLAARAFSERAVKTTAFRLMRAYMRCSVEECRLVAEKVYCVAIPGSVSGTEGALKRYLGLFIAPAYLLAGKSWRARPEPRVDWQLEVEDGPYFAARFERAYGSLPGSKRVSPRVSGSLDRDDATAPADASVAPRAWWLLLLMPLAWPSAAMLGVRERADVLRAFRGAWLSYAVWDGYFRRYPCRDFITYADNGNEPSRGIAFRQHGGERLTAVQNGVRVVQPIWACGDVDLYLMFGPYYEGLVRRLGYRLGATASIGSVGLDSRAGDAGAPAAFEERHIDVLLLDSGALEPSRHSGLCPEAVRAEEDLYRLVGRFARSHPELRVACAPRPYDPRTAEAMRAIAEGLLGQGVEVIANTGAGESYDAARDCRVAITFQSTMGYEAFHLGATTLFVNYSGLADQTLCDDARFQIESPEAEFGAFEERVLELLRHPCVTPPQVALEHICAFDGRAQERMVAALDRSDTVPHRLACGRTHANAALAE